MSNDQLRDVSNLLEPPCLKKLKTKEDSSLCVQNATSSGKENHVDGNPTDSIVDLKCNANLWQQKF